MIDFIKQNVHVFLAICVYYEFVGQIKDYVAVKKTYNTLNDI